MMLGSNTDMEQIYLQMCGNGSKMPFDPYIITFCKEDLYVHCGNLKNKELLYGANT